MALISSSEIPEAQRPEYERGVAKMRLSINGYLEELEGMIDVEVGRDPAK